MLRARIDSWRALLDEWDGGGAPPDPPPGGEPPPPGARGFADAVPGCWYNAQRKGRPTCAEGTLAAVLLVQAAIDDDELADLHRAVQEQSSEWRCKGDLWVPPKEGDWGKGRVVLRMLARAMNTKLELLHPVAELLRRDAVADESADEYHRYLRRLRLKGLMGPVRNAKGNSAQRWTAALPEILEQIEKRKGGLRGLQRALPASAAATPLPSREQLQQRLSIESDLVRDLRTQLTTAHGAKRKARFDGYRAVEQAQQRKADIRKQNNSRLQARIKQALEKAKEKAQRQVYLGTQNKIAKLERLKNKAHVAKRAAVERAGKSDSLALKRLKRQGNLERELQVRTAECEALKGELQALRSEDIMREWALAAQRLASMPAWQPVCRVRGGRGRASFDLTYREAVYE